MPPTITQPNVTSTSTPDAVQGNVASGVADAGNPVKVGGTYSAAPPTLSDGQRGDMQLYSKGQLRTVIQGPAGTTDVAAVAADGDGVGSQYWLFSAAMQLAYNGVTRDRVRNNVDGTALASAARTVTTPSADIVNYNGRGVDVILDMTNVGTGSVTMTIQGKDVLSGQYYTILAGLAVVTNSTNVYHVYPGLVASGNVTANAVLPRTWRVNVVANLANSATYSVGYSLIL